MFERLRVSIIFILLAESVQGACAGHSLKCRRRQYCIHFNDVLASEQERDKRISEARGYTNSLISLAEGEASIIVSKGQSDRVRLLQSLAADASAFTNYLAVYERNPELYRQILLTESWQRVLTNAQEKFFLPERADGARREMRLLLNREPLKPSTGMTNQVR